MCSFKISRRLIIFALTSMLALLALLGYARWAAAPVAAKVRLAGPANLTAGRFALPQDGLTGYWPFNGDGTDLSGGGRDVGLAGGVGFAGGLFGQALDLHNNGSQFAARPGDDAIYDFGASDFTIQVWVNFNNTSREQTLIEKFSASSGPGWTLTKLDSNALHFYAAPTVVLTSPSLSIPSGVWHHIVARRNGSLFQVIYDGIVVAAGSSGGAVPDTGMPLLIGKRNAFDGRNFAVDGRIDETAIWSRALTDEEVVFLFNGGSGNPVVPANTAPVARCQNVIVGAGANCTADVSIDAGSSDPDGDPLTFTQSPPGPYPVGMTSVMLTVTDGNGGSSTCSATVTVVDQAAPVITVCPTNKTLSVDADCQAVIPDLRGEIAASDNCTPFSALTITQIPAPGMLVGLTRVVSLTVKDAAGNVSSRCPVRIDVVDARAPLITLTGAQLALWPPNHQYETVNIAQLVASASDNCDGNFTASVVIAQVSSDEPEDAPGGGDGSTLNDIVIAADCKSVQLRAERQGSGNGRVYTITFKVRDAGGNVATATAKVTVPKSQNGAAAGDNGASYTVLSGCP